MPQIVLDEGTFRIRADLGDTLVWWKGGDDCCLTHDGYHCARVGRVYTTADQPPPTLLAAFFAAQPDDLDR